MEKRTKVVNFSMVLFFFFFFFSAILTGVDHVVEASSSSHRHHHHDHQLQYEHKHDSDHGFKKLFVFGDSYVDTGNNQKLVGGQWKFPYGITFPGKPSGRFSDGRVFTDFIASFVGVKSPIPYRWRKIGKPLIPHGMNFAHGGTGVFDTLVLEPNMTTQINSFKQLLVDGWYTKPDLSNSIALLSVAGNDYSAYYSRNGTNQGLQGFIKKVVNQVGVNLREVHSLGVKKVVVMGLEPLGCLPNRAIVFSYQKCKETENTAVGFHNLLLQQMVQKLNNETTNSPFIILDLYTAFMSVLSKQGSHHHHQGSSSKSENLLKPCCEGISNEYGCGSVNEKGEKKYTICENPTNAFFWDGVHPTQHGWEAVYSALRPSLNDLFY